MILLCSAVVASETASGAAARPGGSSAVQGNMSHAGPSQSNASQAQPEPAIPQEPQASSTAAISAYEGKIVQSIQLPGVAESDREHLLQLLPQTGGEPLDRAHVGDSIRALYATGRFADIEAEV